MIETSEQLYRSIWNQVHFALLITFLILVRAGYFLVLGNLYVTNDYKIKFNDRNNTYGDEFCYRGVLCVWL